MTDSLSYHPLDGIRNPKDKLMCFLTTILQREEGTSFLQE
jgi:hypothetical protein